MKAVCNCAVKIHVLALKSEFSSGFAFVVDNGNRALGGVVIVGIVQGSVSFVFNNLPQLNIGSLRVDLGVVAVKHL